MPVPVLSYNNMVKSLYRQPVSCNRYYSLYSKEFLWNTVF